MLTGPAPAARKALAKAGLEVGDIDLWEMNEAFAAVAMRFMKDMGISHEVTNVNGGAIAMGHPLGATGAMILGTLIDELRRRDQRRGLATLVRGWRHGHRHHRRSGVTAAPTPVELVETQQPQARATQTSYERRNSLMTEVVSTGSTGVGDVSSDGETTAVRYDKDADGIVTLTLDDPTANANTMNELYQRSMRAAVDHLYDELAADPDSITGVVVASAKKSFFAGGNLSLMVQARPEDAPRIFAEVESMKADLRRLERLPKPVVAAINGAALGGGFEITLACQHRILVDDPKAEVGLPEASLGLLPGGGGVTRVTRMLGLQSALMDVLLQGTRFKPADAHKLGLVHELVATREELVPAAKSWILEHRDDADAAQNPWDRPGYKMPGGTPRSPALAAFLPAFPALLRQQTKGADYPAQRALLAAAVEGAMVDIDTALRIESRYLTSLMVGQNAKNMIQALWFDLQAINAGKFRPDGVETFRATKVAVLGAGMMGAGIAYSCARAGMDVVLKDVALESAVRGKGYSEKLLDKAISRGRSTEEKKAELLARITPDLGRRRPVGLRPGDRGGLRGPEPQAPGLRRGGVVRQRRCPPLLQHLDAADHRAGHGSRPARRLHRAALLQPRRQDAARRDHQGQGDLRRGAGQGL